MEASTKQITGNSKMTPKASMNWLMKPTNSSWRQFCAMAPLV
jgi:hypothetical protein